MPFLTVKDKTVFFIHIPKTGGRSIYANIRDLGGEVTLHHEDGQENVRASKNAKRCNAQHWELAQLDSIRPEFRDYNPFTVIRDPWERTCSEFRYRGHVANDFTFYCWENFDGWLSKNLTIAQQRPYHLDNHLRPQSQFYDENIKVFNVKMYDEAIEYMEMHLDITLGDKIIRETEYLMPSKEILSKKTLELWEDFYKEDSK